MSRRPNDRIGAMALVHGPQYFYHGLLGRNASLSSFSGTGSGLIRSCFSRPSHYL